MPKKIHNINQFHGGINNGSDPRDIREDELVEVIDVAVDNIGRITTLGSFEHHDTVDARAITPAPGKGLLYFSHDRLEGETAGEDAAETGDNYLAAYDSTSGVGNIDVYSKLTDNWATIGDFDLGASTIDSPCMFFIDGALRASSGVFNISSHVNHWYGYINRTVFEGTDQALALNGWYAENQDIAAGTLSNANIRVAEDAFPTEQKPSYHDNNGYVSLQVEANIKSTGGMRGFKRYYYSLVYDGVQESKLKAFDFNLTTLDTTWQNSSKRYKLYVAPDSFDGDPFSKRVTGIKVYWKKVDSQYVAYDDAYLLFTSDFVLGTKSVLADTYIGWATNGSNSVVTNAYIEFNDEPRTQTYRSETGFSEDCVSLSARYKTAVIVNRMTYIGNILAKSNNSPGEAEVMGDAMIKSPINQFDSFPTDRMIEVAIRDGDEIIHLEEFADRILQFKKNILYIINVSQDMEFLENSLKHKGVNNPGSVAKTDIGIAWANKHSVYFYDGSRVHDLIEKNGIKLISDSEWDSFLTADKDPLVGYVPNKKQLIVADTVDADGEGKIYLYDFTTKSWVKGAASTITDAIKSNFVNDWDGKLIYQTSGYVWEWDSSATATSSLSIKTKDVDFRVPDIKKNVYALYITYKGTASAVTVKYAIDGDTDAPSTNFESSDTPLSNVGTDDWVTTKLSPTSAIKNIYSIQIQLGGTAGADFEINSMAIIYRVKGIR